MTRHSRTLRGHSISHQATDIQAAATTPLAGATGRSADAGHAHDFPGSLPADNNLLWWTCPPVNAGGANVPSAANVPGKLTLQRVLLRRPATPGHIWFGVSANDAGATFVNCYLGIYDALTTTGNLLAQTADISTSLHTSAVYGPALTTPPALPAGEYFIALLLGAGSTWTTFNLKSTLGGVTANAGLAAPHLNLASLTGTYSALPATINLAAMDQSLITGGWGSQWYGLGT